jgi:CO/xanthine dehydrogenase FAD-binding subunit
VSVKAFEYVVPTTVTEALTALSGRGDRVRALAGGTDLIVQLRREVLDIDRVVDVKRIPELNVITYNPNEGLTIGAAVPCHCIVEHPSIIEVYPGLVDAVALIGGTAIRGRATMGGNLCNAAPSGDSIPAMIVLGATCTIAGPGGMRKVAVEQFCIGPGKTVLGPDELLVSMHFPPPVPHSGACYLRFTPRHAMDIAVVGVAASIVLSLDRAKIASARIALGAVGPTPLLVKAAGEVLRGEVPSEESFAEAARLAQKVARPMTDARGTETQRRHLVGVLVRRALRMALERTKGGSFHEH